MEPRARETFQKFWTKDKTENLLQILEKQAENGDIQHDKVAKLLSKRLNLQTELAAEQIIDRISIMVANFKREVEKEQKSGIPSQWRWKQQLHDLIQKLQRKSGDSDDEVENEPPPAKVPKESPKVITPHPTPVIVTNEKIEPPISQPEPPIKPEVESRVPTPQRARTPPKFDSPQKIEIQPKTMRIENGQNNQMQNIQQKQESSPMNITYNERRGRMPDLHVEVLLDCYKFVLQNRMLSSGRLGKGSFQEVADEMNKRCKMPEDNCYEREQLAAKLQNLKTQFRNRKIAVDEGRESASAWKWYNIMDDLSQAESLLRESFDATSKLHANYSNSPILAINDDDEEENDTSRKQHFSIIGGSEKRHKREWKRIEMEQSIGDLSILLNSKTVSEDQKDLSGVNLELSNMRSMACQLLSGFSAILNYVNTPPES